MMKIFIRGLAITCPMIVLGVLIARYVPTNVVNAGLIILILFVIYIAGSILRLPWERK